MSEIGDLLAKLDGEFVELLEDDLEVTNYVQNDVVTGPEEWDSPDEKQPSSASPIATTGQVEPINQMGRSGAWGRDTELDVELLVPSDVTISDGEVDGYPYPSDVRVVATDETYRIVAMRDENNGRRRCAAVSTRR